MGVGMEGIKFVEIFEKALNELTDSNILNDYKRSGTWTPQMEKCYLILESMIRKELSGNKINLYSHNCRKEFMNIDASFWKEDIKAKHENELLEENGKKGDRNLWNPLIAIEHENDGLSSLHELKQLLFANVPLRVWISYVDIIKIGEFETPVSTYSKIFEEFEQHMHMRVGDQIVMLFGCSYAEAEENNKIRYTYIIGTKGKNSLSWSKEKDIVVDLK